jgi:uncharacterized membrane protein YphA (DoxX/SURF4 family)
MAMLGQLEQWSTRHHPRWLVVLRVALGLCLFFKGFTFMRDTVTLQIMLSERGLSNYIEWLPLVITWIHLLGGFLIIIGLLTRWAVLIQIPILIGAIFLIGSPTGVFASGTEFVFALFVLLLLIFFFFEGGGPISIDNFIKKNPN